MDYNALAELLYPDISGTIEEMELKYPPRNLKEGAAVTRIAPSPTGFMHLGNLFGAIADERLAHQSGGVFLLRIEDTDQKREVAGGVEMILKAFADYKLSFDEGATIDGDNGLYGPYRQRQRVQLYQICAKWLIAQGRAYPCFCSEEELATAREVQAARKDNFGYYGSYAVHREMPFAEIEKKIAAGEKFVLRFKSPLNEGKRVKFKDLVKGEMEFPENDQDTVILKSDGVPTYHFAHVVDDHFMRTTHVIRGEEWLATLPIHLQLFGAMGWKLPKFIHTAQLLKMDGDSKRKLSKRKDPELALDFYKEEGFCVDALKEYIITLLNSNFEDWRIANPLLPLDDFPFTVKKMGVSGALFDMEKLLDVSKNVISRMRAEEVYALLCDWAKEYDPQLHGLLTKDSGYTLRILSIGRGGAKPRKDLAIWREAKEYLSFFFDELFEPIYKYPENVNDEIAKTIIKSFGESYNIKDDSAVWFEKIKDIATKIGFAANMKDYKNNPQGFGGHVGDVSMVLRIAITGRQNSPDMYEVMQLLGREQVAKRLQRAAENIA